MALVVAVFWWNDGSGMTWQRVKTPWLCLWTRYELSIAAQDLREAYVNDGRAPAAPIEHLRATGNHAKDPWGLDYVFEESLEGFTLRSAGPDRRFRTRDDLVESHKLPEQIKR